MKYFLVVFALLMMISVIDVQGQTSGSKINLSEYEKWISPYRVKSSELRFSTDPSTTESRPKMIITVVTEKLPSADNKDSLFLGNGKSSYGAVVSTDGEVSFFSRGPFGAKGGGCAQIEKDEREQLDRLLAKLPSDKSILPPIGRRIVLQVAQAENFDARVYDLANMPDGVLEILRLTKSQIRSHILWFEPETEWPVSRPYNDGGLAITSDGQQIISSGLNGPIKIWQTDAQSLLREIPLPQNLPFDGLVLSPDDSLAIIDGWGVIGILDTKTWQKIQIIEEPFIDRKRFQLSKPHFIKNGNYLLLESSEPTLHIYDTKTWKRLPGLSEIPPEAISFYPAATKNRAVYSSKDGQIFLRDTGGQRNIATIDTAKLEAVAFSPDESRVIIVTANHKGDTQIHYKIRIWNADNGKFEKELHPFEQDFCESVEGLLWSPDGKYFLAATKANSFFTSRGISVWNVESGRHRGDFSGCPTKITGLGFLSGKNKIVAGCGDSVVRIWDLAKALDNINKFEESINNK